MKNTKVWDICTQHEVAAGAPNRTLESAFLIMNKNSFRRLPITKIGKIFGMLTVTDLLRAVSELGLPAAYKAKVSDYMTPNPVTIHQESTVYDAVKKMAEKNFGSLIVVGTHPERITGILTERDIVRVAKQFFDPKTKLEVVEEMIKGELHELDVNTTINDAINEMRKKHLHRIIVLREGVPYGVLSSSDILSLITREKDEIISNPNFIQSATVGFLTSSPLFSTTLDSTVHSAIDEMLKNSFGGLPVFDSNKELVGMFSERTLVHYLATL